MLWVRIPLRRGVLNATLYDKVCQWLATGLWFSQGTLVSSTNKTDCQVITEILLKVALNTITTTNHIILSWLIILQIAQPSRIFGVCLIHCTGTTAGFMESLKDKVCCICLYLKPFIYSIVCTFMKLYFPLYPIRNSYQKSDLWFSK